MAAPARLAETLLTKEVMYAEDLKEIFGPRQWRSRTEEIMRLQAERDAAREAAQQAQSESSADNADDTPATSSSDAPEDVEAVEVSSQTTPPPF